MSQQVNEPELRARFFEERGYKRYRCRICGEYFWSLVPRETCPDRPCSKYEFLRKDYQGMARLSFDEARRKFIEYFTKNNHGYVEPYPVLARWRNDLYLTIASIIVFQPAVTEGIVDPPSNPLVIVQPSIRLEDIDNVGYTFGRHMTSFEMGGHHAFNKENKYIYWVEETLNYSYEFFTKIIGIRPKDLVYKESWWEGGGNAGPAFEVVVDGLELATLVFMKYKLTDSGKAPNPVLVVDTGYGIERIAWFTQKEPTSFHAIYGGLVEKYSDLLGVEEPPREVLRRIVYMLSDKDIRGSKHLYEHLKQIGLEEYYEQVLKSIQLYTLLDHARTISLMLSDGIVPSNVGEGYLARLVIRRALKTLMLLGYTASELEDVFLELLSLQANYWKGRYVYDKFHRHMDYIMDVASYETRKFIDAIERGIKIVDKMIKRKKNIGLDDLIKIYDSHGIPPEIVAERARSRGIPVDVPQDFYSLIAEKHGGSRRLVKEKEQILPEEITRWAQRFPETRRLFHINPYTTSFNAKVLGVNGRYIVLDQTIFYPKAGGQDHDEGYLLVDGEKYNVKSVYKAGNVLVHELDREPGDITGREVYGEIDWRRRYRLMRHHTATHIILGAARKVLGDHVWQAGAEKTIEKARLDITHHKLLSPEEIRRIEEEANRIIDMHIDLQFHMLPKYEAEKKYGLRIYQGGAVVSPILRIVEIPGWDAEACFGTHVYNTSEVGGIKIVNVDKIQDGVIRLEFMASTKLPEYIDTLHREIIEAKRNLGVEHGSLTEITRNVSRKLRDYKEKIDMYRSILRDKIVSAAETGKKNICGVPVVVIEKEVPDETLYKQLIEIFSLKKKYMAILVDDNLIEIALHPETAKTKNIDLRQVVGEARKKGAVGGGKSDHVFIRIQGAREKLGEILDMVEKTVCHEP